MKQNKIKKSWYKSVIFIGILLVILGCFFYKQQKNSDFTKTYFQENQVDYTYYLVLPLKNIAYYIYLLLENMFL